MRGRVWVLLGLAAGVVLGIVRAPYLFGAATLLAGTAERLVGSAGSLLVRDVAHHGAGRRATLGVFAVLGLVAPGVTALLLVVAARLGLRLRLLIGLLVLVIGTDGFHYFGRGVASGSLVLALGAAGLAVVAAGPLVVVPLAGLAGLLATEFLPRLFTTARSIPHAAVEELHRALFATPGSPWWLEVVLVAVAALPFAAAARLALA